MKSNKYRRFEDGKGSKLNFDFCPRNEKQELFSNMIRDNEITIAKGVSGSGKTYVALANAINMLDKEYKQVILCKSVTPIPGEEVGFLKGDLAQKMEPYMMSFIWNLNKICGVSMTKTLMEKKTIEILPLAFIRGLSIDNSIVIIDEAQNIDMHTFKTLITRIGTSSKYILLGDTEQVDRKRKRESCLEDVMDIYANTDLIGTIEFGDEDCVRNPIIPKLLEVLRDHEERNS